MHDWINGSNQTKKPKARMDMDMALSCNSLPSSLTMKTRLDTLPPNLVESYSNPLFKDVFYYS